MVVGMGLDMVIGMGMGLGFGIGDEEDCDKTIGPVSVQHVLKASKAFIISGLTTLSLSS
jgi:hypothetical protein